MSGGVIKDYATKTVAKVVTESGEGWYFCELPAFEGDTVTIELDGKEQDGVVEKILYNVTSQSSPVPFSRMRSVLALKL